MWSGYFENEKPFWDEYGISPIHVHTTVDMQTLSN